MAVSMLCTTVVVVVCLQAALHKAEHQSGENDHGSRVCLLESYVTDEIKKGIFNFLELFIDDSVMLLEKYTVEIF
jgi:hypothetical protein